MSVRVYVNGDKIKLIYDSICDCKALLTAYIHIHNKAVRSH